MLILRSGKRRSLQKISKQWLHSGYYSIFAPLGKEIHKISIFPSDLFLSFAPQEIIRFSPLRCAAGFVPGFPRLILHCYSVYFSLYCFRLFISLSAFS